MEIAKNQRGSGAIGTIEFTFVFLAVILLIFLLMGETGTNDANIFVSWISNAAKFGLRDGFAANHDDNPPFASAILWIFHLLTRPLALGDFWTLKTALLSYLLASSAVFFAQYRSPLGALLIIALFAIVSVDLAYLDILFTPSLIGALWALKTGRLKSFSVLIAVAALTKWQPLIIFPFILVHLLKGDNGGFTLRNLWPAFYPGALIGLAVIVFYGWPNLEASLLYAFSLPFLSGNSLNLGWLITLLLHVFRPETYHPLSHSQVEFVVLAASDPIAIVLRDLFYAAYGITLLVFATRRKHYADFLLFTAIGFFAYVMLNTNVHENHSVILALLLFLLAFENAAFWSSALYAGLMLNLNLLVFYGIDSKGFGPGRVLHGVDLTVLLAALNLAFFIFLWWRNVAREIPTWLPRRTVS